MLTYILKLTFRLIGFGTVAGCPVVRRKLYSTNQCPDSSFFFKKGEADFGKLTPNPNIPLSFLSGWFWSDDSTKHEPTPKTKESISIAFVRSSFEWIRSIIIICSIPHRRPKAQPPKLFTLFKILQINIVSHTGAADIGLNYILIDFFIGRNYNRTDTVISGINPVVSLLSRKNESGH